MDKEVLESVLFKMKEVLVTLETEQEYFNNWAEIDERNKGKADSFTPLINKQKHAIGILEARLKKCRNTKKKQK